MSRYRRKPDFIEAFKTDEALSCLTTGAQRPDWITLAMAEGAIQFRPDVNCWITETLDGQRILNPGDWIIRGAKGGIYPCSPGIFEATYEEVE